MASDPVTYPLPADPVLADVAATMRDDRSWGQVLDADWDLVYVTDDLRRSFGAGQLADFAIGTHLFGPEAVALARSWRYGANSPELLRQRFALLGGFMLADSPGGRDEIRERVDPIFHDMIDDLEPSDAAAVAGEVGGTGITRAVRVDAHAVRIRDDAGRLVGTGAWSKPATGMDTISALVSNADLGHLERTRTVAKAARRPAAILFADLEGSTPLSRRLSTAADFSLARRLVRTADRCVIDAGGLVGRHVGDGVVAFFLAETSGSESAAAQACITAMRTLRAAVAESRCCERASRRGPHAPFRPPLGIDALRRSDHHIRAVGGHGARRRGERGRSDRGVRDGWTSARIEEARRDAPVIAVCEL